MRRLTSVFACLLLAVPCHADIITVDDDGPADFNTIQAAIDDANNGDIIIVADGNYSNCHSSGIDFNGKAITVKSENGPGNCIVDCNYYGRGFRFENSETADSVVDGFTVTNADLPCGGGVPCHTYYGGGFYCYQSNPTIRNCVIRNNYSHYGGGIYSFNPPNQQTIINCIIADNDALYGGGIHCINASMKIFIINCTISNNFLYGIECSDSTPIVQNSILWGNNPGQINYYGVFPPPVLMNCDVQGGWASGSNIINLNPLFANPASGDYHLKSEAGRWDSGINTWVTDSLTSPCIDFGIEDPYPDSNYSNELWPHGKRVNIGAYGNTPQASMSLSDVGNIADLDCNDIVNYLDLKLFTDKWLSDEILLAEDLDRNGLVDFFDYAIFTDNFEAAIPLGINWNVQPCNQGASQAMAEIENMANSESLRFSVTVQGHYIYFEDVIIANCCMDEIELQMTIDGDQIEIREIEHVSNPCRCICNYPTTATLGPFAPGQYLLEVIDIDGQSLGVVPVTID
jgi:hypothetical protein